jgi:hypothetical protein
MEVNVQDVNAAPSDRLLFLPESVERKGLLRQTEVAMAQRPSNAYRPWCGLSYLPVISEAEIDQRLQNHIARAFLGPHRKSLPRSSAGTEHRPSLICRNFVHVTPRTPPRSTCSVPLRSCYSSIAKGNLRARSEGNSVLIHSHWPFDRSSCAKTASPQ